VNDHDPNEPISVMRVVEFAVAVLVLAVLGWAWVYNWFSGSLLAKFLYGG